MAKRQKHEEARRFLAAALWAIRRANRELPRLEIPKAIQEAAKAQGHRFITETRRVL